MPRRRTTPALTRHAPSQQGRVRLSGEDHYLGRWPAGQHEPPADVQAAYDRLILRWIAGGRGPLRADGLLVVELIERYLPVAAARYRSQETGRETGELPIVRTSLRHLRLSHGDLECREFGSLELIDYRTKLVDWRDESGGRLSRGVVNKYVWRVKRMFRWAAEQRIFPEAANVRLQLYSVRGLTSSETDAPNHPERVDPPLADVRRVQEHLGWPLREAMELQMLTGMRPGEVVGLDAARIDRSRTPWEYRPVHHKTRHRGKTKLILFGPQARAVLETLEARARDGQLFPQPKAPRGYNRMLYSDHVAAACLATGVTPFVPHQLRHYAGTQVERAHGEHAAAAVLGNTVPAARVYTHAREDLARRVIEELG